jgi:sarcosine oxidase subunit delta
MRLTCPFCGERDSDEFVSIGTAGPPRPQPDAPLDAFVEYLHVRDNPAGEVREHWQHVHGCRQWLVVTRDSRTHLVTAVQTARERDQ